MTDGCSIRPRELLLLTGLFLGIACGSGSTKPDGPDLPDTPDLLVSALRDAYEHRQLDRMGELLLPEYEFHFDPVDIDTLALDTLWTRDRDLAAAKLMWEGSAGVWPDGSWHSPVDLRFPFGLQLNTADSVWTPGVGEDAGMLFRVYRSGMIVNYDDATIDIVTGHQKFYVVEVPRRGYALRKWIDLGGGPGIAAPETPEPFAARLHNTSWGYVRGVFRRPGPE